MKRGGFLNLAALALAAGVTQAAYASPPPALPAGFTAQDIGAVKAGDTTVSGSGDAATVWTLTSQGGDIQKPSDYFRYVYTMLPGDGGITARLLTQTGGSKIGWAKSGVMLRASVDPASAMGLIAYGSPGTSNKTPQIEYLYRTKTGATTVAGNDINVRSVTTGPFWFRAQRQGTNYQFLSSDNGKDWKLYFQTTLTIDATKPVLAGLIDSNQNGADPPAVATFDNVSVSSDIVRPNPPAGPSLVEVMPGDGQVLLTFSTAQNAVGYNIYRQVAGSTGKPVLVNAQPDPYGWFVDTGLTNGTNYLYSVTVVTRSLADNKTPLEGTPSAQVLAEPQVPVQVPAGALSSIDITTTTPGSTMLDNSGVLTITASGADITGTGPDGFRFVGGTVSGDYSLSAKLLEKPSQGPKNTETWVKAGVMIRASLDPRAAAGWVVGTTGQGAHYEHRSGYAVASNNDNGSTAAATTFPLWVRISKSGDNISGFQSSDGTTWKQIGKAVPFTGLSLNPYSYAGLAVTAHKDATLVTAKFDAASIQLGPPQ